MAINFPNNPSVNDTFTVGGINFTFTGVKWESSAVVEISSDTTPSLGGTLDAGTHNINNVGVITATTFSGNLIGNVTGTATTATYAQTAGIATNAQGLTGDPSIQVTNATVLGNLDVQGTTTTIDTAITEVDSLNVEGSVGIGTTNPGAKLEVHSDTIPRINTVFQGSKHFGMSVGGSGCGFVLTGGHFMTINHQPYADRGTDNNLTERLRIKSDGLVDISGGVQVSENITPTSGAGLELFREGNGGGQVQAFDRDNGTSLPLILKGSQIQIFASGSERLTVNSSGNVVATGTISDSIGSLRDVPLNDQSSNASYTLIASDAGKVVHAHSTTTTVVVPNSVFSAGNVVTILNGGTSNITITQGSGLALRNSGDGSTGNRTLAQFGMATIYFTGASVCYISGSNMT